VAVIEALCSLDLHYPKVKKEKLKELAAAKEGVAGGQMIGTVTRCSISN
jgi:hypothetical protein